jgi:hypothetical protein
VLQRYSDHQGALVRGSCGSCPLPPQPPRWLHLLSPNNAHTCPPCLNLLPLCTNSTSGWLRLRAFSRITRRMSTRWGLRLRVEMLLLLFVNANNVNNE